MTVSGRLFGREKELDAIAIALEAAAGGTKRGVILLGEPGIGKSALLRAARAAATDEGFVTGLVRAPEVGVPHSPMPQLLEDLRATCRARNINVPPSLHRAMELMRGTQPRAEPEGLLPLVAEAIESVGTRAPVGLFVDDYHRAHPEGVYLLLATLRAIDGPFVLAVTVRTSSETREPLAPVPEADLWIDHIDVSGLPLDGIDGLATDRLGGEVLPSLTQALMDQTLGNPLFIEEVLRAWLETGAVDTVGGFWGPVNGIAHEPPPRSLAEMVADRLARLGADALPVARTLAVIGRDARFDEIRATTGADRPSLVALLTRLRESGVCLEEPGPPVRYRLAHPLYESSIRAGMSATEVASLHQTVLDALRPMRGPRAAQPAELAHHGMLALEPPEDLADLLARAAEAAELAGSAREAARWWERVGEMAGGDAEIAARALAGQARATVLFDAGEAVSLFTRALDVASEEERLALLTGRATAYRRKGGLPESADDLEQALRVARGDEHADVRLLIAVNRAVRGDLAGADEILRELESSVTDPMRKAHVSGTLAGVRYARGEIDEATALVAGALDPALADGARHLRGNRLWLHFVLGEWEQAMALAVTLIEEGDRAGDLWNLASPLAAAARIHAWQGRAALAVDLGDRAVKISRRMGNPADQIDALEALAVTLLEAGRPSDAAEIAERIRPLFEGGVEYRPDYPWSFAACAEAFLEAGDPVRAQEVVRLARVHEGDVGWRVSVDRVAALIQLRMGASEDARALLQPWIDEPSRFPFEQARAEEAAARVLFDLGERDPAVACAERALATYQALQTTPRVERMEAWLARRRRRPVGRPRSTLPAGMTPRELEVLHLVLHSLTNAQIADVLFISPATARKHVENLMRKAGATRRTQLLEFAREHGIRPAVGRAAEEPPRRRGSFVRVKHTFPSQGSLASRRREGGHP